MKHLYCILLSSALIMVPLLAQGQIPLLLRGNASGLFSLGMRSTLSMFNGHDWNTIGLGAGGHFRLQLFDQVNSEWFADVAVSDIGGYAHREDFHIGASIIFYPLPGNIDYSKPVKPFIEVGYCFDLTRIIENQDPSNQITHFSSALPVGLGAHFNLTQRFDVTLKAQYMMHLGSDIDVEKAANGDIHIEKHQNTSIEGHLFITMSINYKLVDLWGKKSNQ